MRKGQSGLAGEFWPCCGEQVPLCLYRSWAAACCPLLSPALLLLLLPSYGVWVLLYLKVLQVLITESCQPEGDNLS